MTDPPLARDMPCPQPTCHHVHRWLACDLCGCPAHPLDDDIEP
jgi:hypothetical protein